MRTPARAARLAVLAAALCAAPAAAGAELLVVLNKSDDEAAFVDLASGEVVARLATGHAPHEGLASPDGRRVYVADYGSSGLLRSRPGHTITVIDVAARAVEATWDLRPHTRPHGLAVSRDGRRLWVTTEGSGSLVELDTASGALRRAWETGPSHMVVPSPDERVLYVASPDAGSVSAVDRASGTVRRVETGDGSEGIAVAPDGSEVWVANRGEGTITVLDAGTLEVRARLPSGGRMPIRVRFTPDGREAWVTNTLGSSIAIFDARSRERLDEIPLRLSVLPGPVGLLFTPDGGRAFVAHVMADRVAEIDVAKRALVRRFETGDHPDGMAYVP